MILHPYVLGLGVALALLSPAHFLGAAPCSGEDGDGDGFTCQVDCDDSDFEVYPGAEELAGNGVDDNCNGQIDEADGDGDGYPRGGDCQDTNAAIYPGAVEVANGIDEDCDGKVDEDTRAEDLDGDGVSPVGGDCDDSAEAVHPGAQEVQNGQDDDCDGLVDEGTGAVDDDGDGYCEGPGCIDMATPGDCVDNNPAIRPGAPEVENGIDDDCDGVVDFGGPPADQDGDGFLTTGGDCNDEDASISPGAEERPNGLDDDCDSKIDEFTSASDDDGDGVSESGGDCDDQDPDIGPDAKERLDGRDGDCDGVIDEDTQAYDDDGDGLSEEAGDCDDTNPAISPTADELPNTGIDENCDGLVDELASFDDELDNDGDGVDAGQGDCDDLNEDIYPGAPEVCDGIDNDCDGQADPDSCGATSGEGCDQAPGSGSALPWLMLSLVALAFVKVHRPALPRLGLLCLALALPTLGACSGSTDVYVAQNQGTLTLSPEGGLLDLGPIFVGEAAQGDAFLLNSGGSPLDILSVRIESDEADVFSVETFKGTLLDGQEQGVAVAYNPQSVGTHLARLIVSHGAGTGGNTAITSMTLRGRAAPISLTLAPETLDYGPVESGAKATRSARLYNHGLATATLSAADLEGGGYTLRFPGYAGGLPIKVEAGAALDIELGADASAREGSLELLVSKVPMSLNLRANICAGSVALGWDEDGDGVTQCGGDCDDTDPFVAPGQFETEDGEDEDCDGLIDEGTQAFDDDGDCACEAAPCTGTSGSCGELIGGDCHDGDDSIYPGAPEHGTDPEAIADGIDSDCDGAIDDSFGGDLDGDGFTAAAGDCAEGDPGINPGATELPGGDDEDCDGLFDEGTPLFDDDGDGYCEAPTCSDGSSGGDCDDQNPDRNPGMLEGEGADNLSDGLDNDCDGLVDEAPYPQDGDGDGYAPEGGDCDDEDASIHPGATEACDGIDNNCDGVIPPSEIDGDGDGIFVCGGDCDDTDGAIFPGATERCNGLDDDCNGLFDPPGDADGDGISNAEEGEGDLDGDGIVNCMDPDGDGDFILDAEEAAAGADPRDPDTDDDGFSDLIEVALGTDPANAEDNPEAGDDLVFVMPYGEATTPESGALRFDTFIQRMDLYFSFDNTSSMREELIAMQLPEIGIPVMMADLTCEIRTLCPDGTPSDEGDCLEEEERPILCEENIECEGEDICSLEGQCIENPLDRGCVPDIFTGVASWSDPNSFENRLGLQGSAALTTTSVPGVGSGTYESPSHAVACAADGIHCNNGDISCETRGIGCPGFREDALPVYIQITDANEQCGGESGSQAQLCDLYTPSYVGALLGETGIRFVCLYGDDDPDHNSDWAYGSAESVCREIGIASGTVDADGEPYVVEGVDADIAPRTVATVRDLISTYPLDVTLAVQDLPGDDGDALAFIESIETNIQGAQCNQVSASNLRDFDGDGVDDGYGEILPGTPVCWTLLPKAAQEEIEAAGSPLTFHALLEVSGGGALLNKKDIYFVVPPVITNPTF